MNNKFAKIELYILSLSVLFVLIIVLTVDFPVSFADGATFIGVNTLFKTNIISCIAAILLLLSSIFYWRFTKRLSGTHELPAKIIEVENINSEPLLFLSTYIIPLSCFDYQNTRSMITLSILLVIVGAIFVKTNTFYANPSLTLLGYSVYRVTLQKQGAKISNCVFISRTIVKLGDEVLFIKLDDKIFYGRVNGHS